MILRFLFVLPLQAGGTPIDIGPYIPVLAAIIGLVIAAIGRFIWKNHIRSKKNKNSIKRYGRALFGDDDDATHDGIAQQVSDVHSNMKNLDNRLTRIEDKIDRINGDGFD